MTEIVIFPFVMKYVTLVLSQSGWMASRTEALKKPPNLC